MEKETTSLLKEYEEEKNLKNFKKLEKGQNKWIYQLCKSVSANYNSKFKQLCINKILLSK